jgi:hypothetical protein
MGHPLAPRRCREKWEGVEIERRSEWVCGKGGKGGREEIRRVRR